MSTSLINVMAETLLILPVFALVKLTLVFFSSHFQPRQPAKAGLLSEITICIQYVLIK